MGLFDRLRGRNKDCEEKGQSAEPTAVQSSASGNLHNVTVNLPSYFKAGNGMYHVVVDGIDNECKPFGKLVLELTEGVHQFKAFSTPETLGEATEQIEIVSDRILSVQVNVRDGTISLKCNDTLRSNVEFREEFRAKNHIGNLEKEGTDRKNP